MHFYLNIDGVLVDTKSDTYAKGTIELIEYVTSEFDCYWLTTHCKGDAAPAIEYLSGYFPPEVMEKLKKFKPTTGKILKLRESTLMRISFGWMIILFKQSWKC